ncbi:type IV pilus twitching motility protein PilT, partial [Candidatus Sumerlaeota bacterium]|nr:type IV pilus twitching motility protein PilT [Candidatus Sumerlaeota bacterium]
MDIRKILAEVVAAGASDLHMVSNSQPIMRLHGRLLPMEYPAFSQAEVHKMIMSLLSDEQVERFAQEMELDCSISIAESGRFRTNIHVQRGKTEAAFRVVTDQIRSSRQLGLPPIIEELARRQQGMILVTGPTGSGKSTTLAAMIDQMNNERACMIITIEDPIEYLHSNKKSVIKQREVGHDTKSFGNALRHALRQDPDVIVVGEMRDLDTISTALTAAETGHLVLATIHTPDVIQTIDRVVDVFPPHQQNQVRLMFASSVQGIIAQQLLPVPGGRGRVVATEILVATPAVRQILRQAKTEQLTTIMQTAQDTGMMTMDKCLKQ